MALHIRMKTSVLFQLFVVIDKTRCALENYYEEITLSEAIKATQFRNRKKSRMHDGEKSIDSHTIKPVKWKSCHKNELTQNKLFVNETIFGYTAQKQHLHTTANRAYVLADRRRIRNKSRFFT